MDVTADTLLNQVSQVIFDKLDKQSFDPKFLQKTLEGILNKFVYKQTNTISQSTPEPSLSKNTGLVEDLKKTYKDLLNDSSYVSNYKQFLKKVFDVSSLPEQKESLTSKPINKTFTEEIANNAINKTYNNENYEEGRKSLIKEEIKPQVVLLGGITEQGYKDLQRKLPNLLKGFFTSAQQKTKEMPQGLGLLGTGVALLLGGLAALVSGLMTDGPFKGLLKILAKTGISGGIKILQTAAKFFIGGLKEVIKAPIELLKDAAKSIGKIFGKDVYKAVLKPIRGLTGLFTNMLSGLAKFLSPLLKRIPLIGTVISWGFAYTRFKSGDVVGGIIDVLSGIATIFPGVGTAIGIGLDVLNAFLDYKTGGATKEASAKKGGVVKGWLATAWNYWKEKILNIPIIKNITEIGDAFSQGDWGLALTKLIRIMPGASWILDWIGMTEEKSTETINTQFNMISDFFTWIKESVIDKITNIVGKVIEWSKEKITNIISNIPGYNLLFGDDSKEVSTGVDKAAARETRDKEALQNQLDAATTEEERKKVLKDWESKKEMWSKLNEDLVQNKKNNDIKTSTTSDPVPLAEGGVVTKPTNAIVGEAGPEAVLPLDKLFSNINPSVNNAALDQIASNTEDTNMSIKSLSNALLKLVTVLDKKISTQGGTTIVNAGGQQSQITSASVIANSNMDPIRRVRSQFAY
jgi:hypothetical protein